MYITKAQDLIKMTKETEKFYKVFCKNTQSKNGMWEQRFFTDGTLAPCWGYQIDETASVIYGIYDHYTRTKDKKFLKDNLKMLHRLGLVGSNLQFLALGKPRQADVVRLRPTWPKE